MLHCVVGYLLVIIMEELDHIFRGFFLFCFLQNLLYSFVTATVGASIEPLNSLLMIIWYNILVFVVLNVA